MRANVIENGVVTNVIEVEALDVLPGFTLIDGDAHPANVGDLWDGTSITPPPLPPVQRNVLSAMIDSAVAAVYSRPMTFSKEYEDREAQAQTFKDAGYTGTVPPRVAGFATPANMNAQAAADLILSQAANMRGALAQLSDLRMQKYAVINAADDATAVSVFNNTMAAIKSIAAQL